MNCLSFSGLSGEMPTTAIPAALSAAERVPEIAGLGRAARGHCSRVEVHDDALTSEIAEADGLPVLVDEGETRGGVAD
jgi:hypothetical protein